MADWIDPFRNFNFIVTIGNPSMAEAIFTECSGLGSTTEIIETREGGDNTTVHKLPGKTSYSDITLKWGLTKSSRLWEWRQEIIDGKIAQARKNGAIIVFDMDKHSEVTRWTFTGAWPTRWEGPTFNTAGNDIAIDTLVLAIEKLTRG